MESEEERDFAANIPQTLQPGVATDTLEELQSTPQDSVTPRIVSITEAEWIRGECVGESRSAMTQHSGEKNA
jgi:hypothetical protein